MICRSYLAQLWLQHLNQKDEWLFSLSRIRTRFIRGEARKSVFSLLQHWQYTYLGVYFDFYFNQITNSNIKKFFQQMKLIWTSN